MQPNQPQQSHGPGPQPPWHAPEYAINPNIQPQQAQQPQRHANGQYEVLPPLPTNANNGRSGHNAYEFIMQPNAPKKKGSFSAGGTKGLLLRAGLVLGGLTVLVIAAAVVVTSLGPKDSTVDLKAIAERQQEIIRVSTAALRKTTGDDTTNFVMNVNLGIITSQQQMIGYLAAHGTQMDKVTLNLDQNTQTDTLLASADTANNYDPAVTENLTSQLQTYETLLKATYKRTSNDATKKLLQSSFDSADLLLRQGNALTDVSRPR
jgi:hypothetical protein